VQFGYGFKDKDENSLGILEFAKGIDNKNVLQMYVYNQDGSAKESLAIGFNSNGTGYTSVSSPTSSTANNNEIATTAFVQNLVSTSASTINNAINNKTNLAIFKSVTLDKENMPINAEVLDTTIGFDLPDNFINGFVIFNVDSTFTTSYPDSSKRFSTFVYDENDTRLANSITLATNTQEIVNTTGIYRVNGNSTGVITIRNKSGIYASHSCSVVNRLYYYYLPVGL
jgi:hypothetical protein